MSVFEDIKTGLNQAIDYEKGKGKAKVTVVAIFPVANLIALISSAENWSTGKIATTVTFALPLPFS